MILCSICSYQTGRAEQFRHVSCSSAVSVFTVWHVSAGISDLYFMWILHLEWGGWEGSLCYGCTGFFSFTLPPTSETSNPFSPVFSVPHPYGGWWTAQADMKRNGKCNQRENATQLIKWWAEQIHRLPDLRVEKQPRSFISRHFNDVMFFNCDVGFRFCIFGFHLFWRRGATYANLSQFFWDWVAARLKCPSAALWRTFGFLLVMWLRFERNKR